MEGLIPAAELRRTAGVMSLAPVRFCFCLPKFDKAYLCKSRWQGRRWLFINLHLIPLVLARFSAFC